MIIIWGSRLYGKVDEVPGLFHVATTFGHFWYIPLIPMGSMVVLAKDGSSVQGMKIPLSAKSIFVAWGRALGIVATLLLTPALISALDPDVPTRWELRVIVVSLFVVVLATTILLWTHRTFRRASHKRALHLGELIGLNDEGRILLELGLGRISDAEAKRYLEEAAADKAEITRLEAEIQANSRPIS